MDQSRGSNGFPWSEWMESAPGLWFSAAQSWQELSTSMAGGSRTEECMKASLSIWRAFLLPWTGVQSSEAKESHQPSFDMIQAIMQVMGLGGLNQEIFRWLWNKGEVTGQGFEKFQHEAVKAWTAIHEKGIQPLLKIPQVGLTRVHQEKINRLADKFNAYQAAVWEFQMLLSVPMEKSFADMKEQLGRPSEKGEPAEDPKI